MSKKKLVMIGNGMAGMRCIEEVLKIDSEGFEITIIGREKHVNYNRIQLSSVLQGDLSLEEIYINKEEWYRQNNLTLYTGETVIEIKKETQLVITDQGREVPFDYLILATGSVPYILPIPGSDKEGVISFRTIEDCHYMLAASKNYQNAIVIGGGLLGLEAARGLINRGMDVQVVHNTSYLMDRQLDPISAQMLQNQLEIDGMKFLMEKQTLSFKGEKRVEAVTFTDGTRVAADLVVMAVGVRPNIELAKACGIHTNRAIVVNDYMETNVPNIYAVGECSEHNGMVYGLVKPLYDQAKILANAIQGRKDTPYRGSLLSTSLKISGINVFSVGNVFEDKESKSIVYHNGIEGIYKKLVFKEDKLIGAILFGDTSAQSVILDVIRRGIDITDDEKSKILKESANPLDSVAVMNKSEFICQCNNVTKGTIISVVQERGLKSVEQIKSCTRASGSCGSCKPLVKNLLAYIHSEDFNEESETKSMCTCTTFTEEQVVLEIQKYSLTSLGEVMQQLNWKNKEGCSVCRPAISYYLQMIYPGLTTGELIRHEQRSNPVKQADGTYSLIPQTYGGLTNGDDLRKIAAIADTYQLRIILTSFQRFQLQGIKEHQLTAIMNELILPIPSNAKRTVSSVLTDEGRACTCKRRVVTELAVQLDKKFEAIHVPDQVNVSISSCLHDWADAKLKDIGIVGIERGFELHLGGSTGRSNRVGELLTVTETMEETIDTVIALLQYYRETANYLERIWRWVERINIIHIREVLFEKELREQLIQRFEFDSEQLTKSHRVYI